jgi:signal transduction histidine kinase
LSRRLAKELGGELRLESSGSEGTTFALRLPKD